MFAYLCGTVAAITESEVVLDNRGVGYALICPAGTLTACRVGDEIKLHTYLQVREDALTLFGFSDAAQKDLFLQLIGVGGIGCKLACQILSGVSPSELALAIASGDTKALSGIKGVGKKTAERIVVELKEKVAAFAGTTEDGASSKDVQDAILALVALGFSHGEAVTTVMAVPEVGTLPLDEIVSRALKGMR